MEPRLPPGPPGQPLSSSLGWWYRPLPFLRRCRARYGDVFTLRIVADGTWVVLVDPEHVKQAFTGDPAQLHAGEGNVVLAPLVGHKSVILLDEGAHMEQRKLLLPPFHGERVRGYADVMTEVAEREVDRWPEATPLRLFEPMQELTLEIILRTVFGVREGGRMDRLRDLIIDLLSATHEPAVLLRISLMGPGRFAQSKGWRRRRAALDELVFDEIRARRSAPDLAERDDVMSMLVQARHEDGSPMSDVELRDELLTLLMAGHETTATALAWAFERLARDPERLARLADGDDAYADAVSKEILRLRPPIPVVLRQLVEPMEIAGHLLPAGAKLAPSVLLLHRREDIYPEPDRFLPERFVDRQPGTYTWIPFGGGRRRCLGSAFAMLEMRAVLQVVARRLCLHPPDPAPEGVRRRTVVLVPGRGAEAVATPAAPSGGSASRSRPRAEAAAPRT